jgi:DNA-binding NarL/FixJ family response regulator
MSNDVARTGDEPRVLVYSDDPKLRTAVITAVGLRPGADVGRIDWVECASGAELLAEVDGGGVAVAILDGEARPVGGIGLAKQLKDELADCPATLVLLARRDDQWLGKWSMADALATLPVDASTLPQQVAELLRQRAAAVPVRRAAGR